MRKDFAGRKVWITGASSGIGRASAIEAAARGASLILSARKKALLEEVATACAPASCRILDFDLTDADARRAACGAVLADGVPDVIILNAGMSQRSTFLETRQEAFEAIMALDFEAQVDILRLCLPSMLARGSGSLVAMSSLAGLAGFPLRPAYSAAKHALAGLFQCLRAEHAGSGLRFVTVYPGFVRTSIAEAALGPDGAPLRAGDPDIEAGAAPADVAHRVLSAALRGRVEIMPALGLLARLGLFLSRRAPSLWARLSARHAKLARDGASRANGP
jgi:short-subunit dehydrogenase